MRKVSEFKDRFWKQVEVRSESECWPWKAKSQIRGYGVVGLGRREDGKMLAHRAAWMITHGPLPKVENKYDAVVMHTCDNRLCCNPAHLRLGTQLENVKDMYAKGRGGYRGSPGERHHNSKLTENEVRAIRADTRGNQEIADDFGITRQNVRFIKTRTAWKHVT